MDSLGDRAVHLRAEIERIKGYLLITTDQAERLELSIQLRTCLRESIALINQRLQSVNLHDTIPQPELRERYMGDQY